MGVSLWEPGWRVCMIVGGCMGVSGGCVLMGGKGACGYVSSSLSCFVYVAECPLLSSSLTS